jgi:4-methylaminobutanoate oxidase (formaldehyde-forming)
MHTMNYCRTEKAYRHFGHDIADEDTPIEAGLGFTIAWDKKGGFIGRDALLKQKSEPRRTKRMVTLALQDTSDTAPMMYHEEPVYRDGVIVGATTSGAWGHRIGKSIGMGYMKCEDGVTKDWIDSGNWEVEIAWKRYPIDVQLAPFYDPKNEKIRC